MAREARLLKQTDGAAGISGIDALTALVQLTEIVAGERDAFFASLRKERGRLCDIFDDPTVACSIHDTEVVAAHRLATIARCLIQLRGSHGVPLETAGSGSVQIAEPHARPQVVAVARSHTARGNVAVALSGG